MQIAFYNAIITNFHDKCLLLNALFNDENHVSFHKVKLYLEEEKIPFINLCFK